MLKEKQKKERENIFCDSRYVYTAVVGKEHILRQVKDRIDFSFLRREVSHLYRKDFGRPAIDPEIIGKMSFLQFYYNLSDREIEQRAGENIAFKYFLDLEVDDPAPCDASTLSKVRTLWGEESFRKYFEYIVEQAKKQGFLGTRRAVDSTKILMNCAVVRYLKVVRRICDKLLKAIGEVVSTDKIKELQENKQQLEQESSWWLSQELKEAYYEGWSQYAQELIIWSEKFLQTPGQAGELACWPEKKEKINKLLGLLKKSMQDNQKEKKKKKDRLVSDVDEDARYSADNKGGVKAGYKGHLSVDTDSELITGLQVTGMNREDGAELLPLMEDETRRGLNIEQLEADTAYSDGVIREGLCGKSIEAFIPEPTPKKSPENKFISQQFQYNAATGEVTCPGEEKSTNWRRNKQGDYQYYFRKQQCEKCNLNQQCLAERELKEGIKRGRTVYINQYRELHQQAQKKQETAEFKKIMKQRFALERKNAELLIRHNLRRARYRTLPKVTIEVLMAATVINIKRMMKLSKPALAKS